jgi:hypothetical protein
MNRLRRTTVLWIVAALLSIGISTFAATPAQAVIYTGLGARCQAIYAAYVCGYINIDDPNDNIRAYGSTADSSTMSVYLRQTVCIEYWDPGLDRQGITYCGGQARGYERVDSTSALEPFCIDELAYRAFIFWAWDPPNGPEVTGTFHSNWVGSATYGCWRTGTSPL